MQIQRGKAWEICLPDVTAHDQISQAFPLHNCILQAIKDWRLKQPGNEATGIDDLHSHNWMSVSDPLLIVLTCVPHIVGGRVVSIMSPCHKSVMNAQHMKLHDVIPIQFRLYLYSINGRRNTLTGNNRPWEGIKHAEDKQQTRPGRKGWKVMANVTNYTICQARLANFPQLLSSR